MRKKSTVNQMKNVYEIDSASHSRLDDDRKPHNTHSLGGSFGRSARTNVLSSTGCRNSLYFVPAKVTSVRCTGRERQAASAFCFRPSAADWLSAPDSPPAFRSVPPPCACSRLVKVTNRGPVRLLW